MQADNAKKSDPAMITRTRSSVAVKIAIVAAVIACAALAFFWFYFFPGEESLKGLGQVIKRLKLQ
ncbi:hypothetical protein KKF59_02900 [Patescibacteria group bacterium]|nr:hypothetical protein [Patescibacteria group bacterium]MBU1034490.1 hypothetical protein [Patescibacteria group bacterium]MBU1629752.1 hypothetical protein [Patescibacteria group bacterium]MBU1908055.1 hypothetical protein [Patescibacteria group bacterium]